MSEQPERRRYYGTIDGSLPASIQVIMDGERFSLLSQLCVDAEQLLYATTHPQATDQDRQESLHLFLHKVVTWPLRTIRIPEEFIRDYLEPPTPPTPPKRTRKRKPS
jgi:hypothetical protein